MAITFKLKPESIKNVDKIREQFGKGLFKGVKGGMLSTIGFIRRNLLRGQLLKWRTGDLSRSLTEKTIQKLNKTIGRISSPLIYARLQELGGTIRPKRAKWLTIPTEFAKTPAGVVKGNARSFADTFPLFRPGRVPLIMQERGDQVVPLFILKKRVKIKGKHFISGGIEKMLPEIRKNIIYEIKKATA